MNEFIKGLFIGWGILLPFVAIGKGAGIILAPLFILILGAVAHLIYCYHHGATIETYGDWEDK